MGINILFKILRYILIALPWVLLFLTVSPLEAKAPVTNEITDSSDGVLVSNLPIPTIRKSRTVQPSYSEIPNTCAQFDTLIEQYDWDTTIAKAVMRAESGCRSDVVNDNPATGDYSVSLFQINLYGKLRQQRPDEEWLKVPANNIAYAYDIYKSQGWKAWGVCRKMVDCY